MLRQLTFAIVAFGMASSALAQEPQACPHAPLIRAAADLFLTEPAEKPNFWRDRHGADAAHLTIRYGGMDEAAADAFLSGLENRSHPPQRIAELRLAHDRADARMARIEARAAGIATLLAGGGAVEDEDRLVAADLLAGAARFDEAVATLAAAGAWQEAPGAAHALMKELDRRCGALLSPVLPMMEPIYRFAPR